jgi:hypothetical protein
MYLLQLYARGIFNLYVTCDSGSEKHTQVTVIEVTQPRIEGEFLRIENSILAELPAKQW